MAEVRSRWVLDADGFRRDVKKTQAAASEAAGDVAKTFATSGKKAGQQSAKEIVDSLRDTWKSRRAQLKHQLAEGIIDKREFRRQANEASKAFNAGIKKNIEGFRREGRLTSSEYDRLAGSLKSVSSQARRTGRRGRRSMQGWTKAVNVLKTAVAGVVAYLSARALFRFFSSSVKVAEQASNIWSRLEQQVENTGTSFARVRPEIDATARALQDTTQFGDEDFAAGLNELISITNDYTASVNEMSTVLDLAAAKGFDLETAARLVGRTMIGDTALLKRYGIVVEEGADAMELLRSRFAGAAENEGKKLSGRLKRLRNEWADVQQAVGEAILGTDSAAESMGGLADRLVSLEDWIRRNETALQGLITTAANAGSALGNFLADWAFLLDPAGSMAGIEIASIEDQPWFGNADALRARLEVERDELEALQAQIDELATEVSPEALQAEIAASRSGQLSRSTLRAIDQLAELKAEAEASRRVIAFLDAEIERLGSDAGGGGGGVPTPTLPDLSAFENMRTGLVDSIEQAHQALQDVTVDGVYPYVAALGRVSNAATRVANAERDLTLARASRDPERIAAAEEELAAAQEAVRVAVTESADALEAAGVPTDELNRLLDIMIAKLRDAGVELDVAEGGLDGLADKARAMEGLARGVLSVSRAVGNLSQETEDALTSMVDLAAGVAQLAEGVGTGNPLAIISGASQVIGGLIGLFSSQGPSEAEIRELEALREQLRRNTRAIEENTRSRTGDLSPGDRDRMVQWLEDWWQVPPGELIGTTGDPSEIGLSDADLARLEEIERATGISIFTGNGDISWQALNQAYQALLDMDLGTFGTDLAGRLDAMQWAFSQLGDAVGGAAVMMERFLAIAEQFSPQFASTLQQKLDELGPEGAQAWLQGLIEQYAASGLTPELEALFGSDLTAEEIQRLLEEGNELLGGVLSGGRGTSRSTQIGRSITEIQANEVVAWLEEIAWLIARFREDVTGTVTPLSMGGPEGLSVWNEMLSVEQAIAADARRQTELLKAIASQAGVGDIVVNASFESADIDFQRVGREVSHLLAEEYRRRRKGR